MCLRARCFVYVFVGLIHLFARTAYVDAVVDRGGVGDDTRLEFGEAIRMCFVGLIFGCVSRLLGLGRSFRLAGVNDFRTGIGHAISDRVGSRN